MAGMMWAVSSIAGTNRLTRSSTFEKPCGNWMSCKAQIHARNLHMRLSASGVQAMPVPGAEIACARDPLDQQPRSPRSIGTLDTWHKGCPQFADSWLSLDKADWTECLRGGSLHLRRRQALVAINSGIVSRSRHRPFGQFKR